MTPLETAQDIARTYLSPVYGHGDVIEAIRVALVEAANSELEKRRAAEARVRALEAENQALMLAIIPAIRP